MKLLEKHITNFPRDSEWVLLLHQNTSPRTVVPWAGVEAESAGQAAWGELSTAWRCQAYLHLCVQHTWRREFSLKTQLRASPLMAINLCHLALPVMP